MLYINQDHINAVGLLNEVDKIAALIESGFISIAKGDAILPPTSFLKPDNPERFYRINAKSGIVNELAGLKWVASAPQNTQRGLPRANSLVILNDIVTGIPYCIMEGTAINAVRTSAVSYLFLKKFRNNFKRAVIFGVGVLGQEHLRQVIEGYKKGHFPHLETISLYDSNNENSKRVYDLFKDVEGLELSIESSLEGCFTESTAVLLCTNVLSSFIPAETIPGAIGLTVVSIGLRELEPKALTKFTRSVVDNIEHMFSVNTSVDLAGQQGFLKKSDCFTLPDLLLDPSSVSFADEENVILNPFGLVSHDLVVANALYNACVKQNIGTTL